MFSTGSSDILAGLHPAFVGGALSEILGALAAWRWIPRGALPVIASAPPFLAASGRGRNDGPHPDWRAEVQPTLKLAGQFKIGPGTFRGVPASSAQSQVTYSNMVWRLPDLTVLRPEGKVEAEHRADDRTKDFWWRVHSTIDVTCGRSLLEAKQQRALISLKLSQPPVIDAEIWGHWHEPQETGGRAHVVAGNFTFRGESATLFRADLQYTNRFLDVINPRVERASQFMTASAP